MKLLLLGLLLLPIAAIGRQPRFLGPPVKRTPQPGEPAPLVSGPVHNPGGADVNLADRVGPAASHPAKCVALYFFSSESAADLRELQRLSSHHAKDGLFVVGVATDMDEAKWPAIRTLLARQHVSFPVLKDPFQLVSRQYVGETAAVPSIFLIDRDGKVRLTKVGYTEPAGAFLPAGIEAALKP